MDVTLATIADIQTIARREALDAGKKILGVTIERPRYVQVPNASDPDAVLEFVVDVLLLDHASQSISFFNEAAGLKRLNNLLIATEAIGNLISTLNTPVEIELNSTGQLQVTGRAKVHLPQLVLDFYDLFELSIPHVVEADLGSDGVYRDAWGVPITPFNTTHIRVDPISSHRLSTLGELGTDDSGQTSGRFGVNQLQRTILVLARSFSLELDESSTVMEEEVTT